MALYHVYNQTVADGTATSVVRPSDWNSAHSQLMTIAGNTAGASTLSGTNVVYQGGNNVTLSVNQGANAATVVVSGPSLTPYLTTARASNDAVGLNTALTANGVSWTVNSSGLSLNVPAFLTTAAQSNHSHNFATTTTNGSQIVVGTTNSAGATIGVPPFLTTAQPVGAYLTTARASNDAIGLNTAGTNVTWTVNSSGLSFNGSGYAGTGTTFAGANVSGSMTMNSNGLNLSLSAPTPGGGGAINVSAGTTSGNLQTVQFNNGNGVSFGLNGSTVTASVNTAQDFWSLQGNTAGTNAYTWTNDGLYLAGGNNITLSGNGSTLTIVGAAGGGGATAKSLMVPQPHLLTTVGSLGTASASVQFIEHPGPLSWTAINIPISVSVTTTGNSSFAGQNFSVTYVIATQTGQTLNSVVSTTWSAFQTWQSNTTGSVTGGKVLSTGWNTSLPAGDYYHILHIQTAATGGGLTGVGGGTATTSLGNTCSIMGVGSAVFGAVTWGALGANTASSNGPWLQGGHGLNSSTGQLTNMSLSNVSKVGTFGQRALFGAIFLG